MRRKHWSRIWATGALPAASALTNASFFAAVAVGVGDELK